MGNNLQIIDWDNEEVLNEADALIKTVTPFNGFRQGNVKVDDNEAVGS